MQSSYWNSLRVIMRTKEEKRKVHVVLSHVFFVCILCHEKIKTWNNESLKQMKRARHAWVITVYFVQSNKTEKPAILCFWLSFFSLFSVSTKAPTHLMYQTTKMQMEGW